MVCPRDVGALLKGFNYVRLPALVCGYQAVCQTAAFPERLSPLLARVVQGSPSPLSKLSEEAAEVIRSSIPQQAVGLTVDQIAAKIRLDRSSREWFLLPVYLGMSACLAGFFFPPLSLAVFLHLCLDLRTNILGDRCLTALTP